MRRLIAIAFSFLASLVGCVKGEPQPVGNNRVTLEEQLEALAGHGIALNEGVTVEDVLHSFDRDEYESKPFETLFFVLGIEVEREPWGRYFSDSAWNLDMECIEGDGSYVEIVKNLARVAGLQDSIVHIRDSVDLGEGEAWVSYTLDGKERRYDAEVDNDWADLGAVSKVIEDFEGNGKRFYGVANGQSSIWYYLDAETAATLYEISGVAFRTNR